MDLDDWTVQNVLFRPNVNAEKPERGYWPVPRGGEAVVEISPEQLFFGHWKKQGLTDEEIEERYARWRGGSLIPNPCVIKHGGPN